VAVALDKATPDGLARRARRPAESALGRKQVQEAQGRDAAAGILSAGEFERCMERERCRADRGSGCFSLVVLRQCELELTARSDREAFAEFGYQLRKRLRSTDLVGRAGVERIDVLLTDTESKGAQVVIAWATQAESRLGLDLEFSMHLYPSAKNPGSRGDRRGPPRTDRTVPEPLDGHEAQREAAPAEALQLAGGVGSPVRDS
jgi:hypothetical protein